MEMLIAILILIALDIVAGVIAAVEYGEYRSGDLRRGLYHKFGTLSLVALAYVLQYISLMTQGLPAELSVVYEGTCLFVILMESSSILENLVKINPSLANNTIMKIFASKINDEDPGDHDV